jgi:hypothetical protein
MWMDYISSTRVALSFPFLTHADAIFTKYKTKLRHGDLSY